MLEPDHSETLTPGLRRYWLMDHQIVVFEAETAYRADIDAWINGVHDVMDHWPADRPYLALHDLRASNIVLTPYARRRAQELMLVSTDGPGYAAILIANSLVGHTIQWLLRISKMGKVQLQVFFDRDEALNWLISKVQQHDQSQSISGGCPG
jgi:hypothetical protein